MLSDPRLLNSGHVSQNGLGVGGERLSPPLHDAPGRVQGAVKGMDHQALRTALTLRPAPKDLIDEFMRRRLGFVRQSDERDDLAQ